jgi:hypothetical protein
MRKFPFWLAYVFLAGVLAMPLDLALLNYQVSDSFAYRHTRGEWRRETGLAIPSDYRDHNAPLYHGERKYRPQSPTVSVFEVSGTLSASPSDKQAGRQALAAPLEALALPLDQPHRLPDGQGWAMPVTTFSPVMRADMELSQGALRLGVVIAEHRLVAGAGNHTARLPEVVEVTLAGVGVAGDGIGGEQARAMIDSLIDDNGADVICRLARGGGSGFLARCHFGKGLSLREPDEVGRPVELALKLLEFGVAHRSHPADIDQLAALEALGIFSPGEAAGFGDYAAAEREARTARRGLWQDFPAAK